jgi:Contractile injection system tube protein
VSGTGQLSRGILASVVSNQVADVIAFQYNPESIRRSIKPQISSEDSEHTKEARFTDAPKQSISFTAYFDAADALAAGNATALSSGIGPQLALLESLIYPTRQQIEDRDSDRDSGVMEIVPLTAPSTMLVWGSNRALPVRITTLEITEDAFDANLNPIRASAAISVEVQTYGQRTPTDDDYRRFGAYHQTLEGLSAQARDSSASQSVKL